MTTGRPMLLACTTLALPRLRSVSQALRAFGLGNLRLHSGLKFSRIEGGRTHGTSGGRGQSSGVRASYRGDLDCYPRLAVALVGSQRLNPKPESPNPSLDTPSCFKSLEPSTA